jgi:hypothetical protein
VISHRERLFNNKRKRRMEVVRERKKGGKKEEKKEGKKRTDCKRHKRATFKLRQHLCCALLASRDLSQMGLSILK